MLTHLVVAIACAALDGLYIWYNRALIERRVGATVFWSVFYSAVGTLSTYVIVRDLVYMPASLLGHAAGCALAMMFVPTRTSGVTKKQRIEQLEQTVKELLERIRALEIRDRQALSGSMPMVPAPIPEQPSHWPTVICSGDSDDFLAAARAALVAAKQAGCRLESTSS
jgi:hypothetical protein